MAVGHPFDLVKVRMQTASASTATSTVTNGVIQASAGTVAKRTVFGILLETFRTQGVRGLYRGATAPLIAVTPVFAMSFWGYDVGQRIVRWTSGSTAPDLTLEQKCIAGVFRHYPALFLWPHPSALNVFYKPVHRDSMPDPSIALRYCTDPVESKAFTVEPSSHCFAMYLGAWFGLELTNSSSIPS